jgi:hypothetical protein
LIYTIQKPDGSLEEIEVFTGPILKDTPYHVKLEFKKRLMRAAKRLARAHLAVVK